MTTPRPLRFGERYGGFVVLACLIGLVVGAVLAYHWPIVGIPVELTLVAVCVLLWRHAGRREREDAARELARLRAIAPPSGAAYQRLLEGEGLGAHLPAIRPLVRRAVRLSPRAGEGGPVGCTRLGGTPDLPPGVSWPQHEGRRLPFLCQLELAQLRLLLPEGPLPAAGHLFFFESPFDLGAEQPAIVLHSQGEPVAFPGPPPDSEMAPFPGRAVDLEPYDDIPELAASANDGLEEGENGRYGDIRNYLSTGGGPSDHKLLGYPDSIQGPVEEECERMAPRTGGRPWRLLLQIGSDDRLGMMWGDAGTVYYCLREDDLAAGRFDRVVVIPQCH